jgi:uncharacterized cupin superfamily protein
MSDASRRGVFKSIDSIELKADPIEPSWVLEGNPQARSGCHSNNADHWAATYVWDCTAGRFKWHFAWEETVVIQQGEVRVTNASGDTHTLVAGSIGYFPAGTWWVWEVPNYVRKLSFNRLEVARPARAVGKLLRLLRLSR